MVNFARPTSIYIVLGAGAIVLICLIIGLISALVSQNFWVAGLFTFSAFGLVAFLWINLHQWRRIIVGSQNKNISWEIDSPESQRTKLCQEVTELAEILQIPADQMSDLLSAYIVAEDLALRQIQLEARLPLYRHVRFGNVPFDAVLVKDDLITFVEVTFLVTPDIKQEKISHLLKKVSQPIKILKNRKIKARIRLLLVLVTQLEKKDEAKLRSALIKKFDSTPVDVDIRLLDFEALQKIYAME